MSAGLEEKSLELHNRYRRIHNAEPLQLNAALHADAQRYAKTLFGLGVLGGLPHSSRESRPGQGENLAKACSAGAPLHDFYKNAIDAW